MQKWDVLYIWCRDIPRPHDKYCICIDPEKNWFLFINSDAPASRKARDFAVCVAQHELPILRHESFIDTTSIERLHPDEVAAALAEPQRHRGPVSPTLRRRIKEAAASHGALNADELAAITSD